MKFSTLGSITIFVAAVSGWVVGGWGLGRTRIVVLSVGQGDCALVESLGRSILIDVGPAEQGRQVSLTKHLDRYNVQAISAILLSHPDADHIGNLPLVHAEFPSAPVIAPRSFEKNQKLLRVLRAAGVRQVWWISGGEGQIGNFRITIRSPKYIDQPGNNDNEGSMFVRLTCGQASYVTTGDAPAVTEAKMLHEADWKSEVMHVGHHGSRYSTSEAWIQAVSPRIAVVSCGLGNRYGHPNEETLERLGAAHVPVLRTDTMGDLELGVVDGHFVSSH